MKNPHQAMEPLIRSAGILAGINRRFLPPIFVAGWKPALQFMLVQNYLDCFCLNKLSAHQMKQYARKTGASL